MLVGLNDTPVGFVDPQCPVEWDHPLNRGMTHWWKVIPNSGWSRSGILRDLVRGGKKTTDGILTNSPTWRGGNGGGRYGSLQFNGSSSYVNIATPVVTAVPVTITAFFWSASTSGVQPIFTVQQASTNNNMYRIILYLGAVQAQSQNGSGGNLVSAGSYTTSKWEFAAGTFSGSGQAAYLNNTGTGSSAISTIVNVDISYIGLTTNITEYMNGLIDDVRVYPRILTRSEINQIYFESKRGCPETLRWVGSTTYGIPEQATPATGVFSPVPAILAGHQGW